MKRFFSKLKAVFVVAGGDTVSGPAHKSAPGSIVLRNTFFSADLPKFQGAYQVHGPSVSHIGIHDGEFILWNSVSDNSEVRTGDIVILNAADCNPDKHFHKDWRCLRAVEGIEDDGMIRLSSISEDQNKKIQSVEFKKIQSKAVYAFTI